MSVVANADSLVALVSDSNLNRVEVLMSCKLYLEWLSPRSDYHVMLIGQGKVFMILTLQTQLGSNQNWGVTNIRTKWMILVNE